jgi:hypothetical protein
MAAAAIIAGPLPGRAVCICLQALRRTLGWFLVAVAVLVPLKVLLSTLKVPSSCWRLMPVPS